MPKSVDLLGQHFGRLTVVSPSPKMAGGKAAWLCRCQCGSTKTVRGAVLTRGAANSCGCLAAELTIDRSTTHGMTHTREWETWHRMKQRCYDANQPSYEHYGGRGIAVCQRWLDDFQHFYDDMGPRPTGAYSIERIDSNGNYEPTNCVWATIVEQNSNKRTNVYIEAFGERLTAAEWARRLETSQTTIQERLKHGWTPEKAVSHPVQRKRAKQ